MTRPVAEIRWDDETEEGHDPNQATHIVKADPDEDGAAIVLEARIYGTPVEALCGHKFIPKQDPRNLPVCSKCKEIYEIERATNQSRFYPDGTQGEALNERPVE